MVTSDALKAFGAAVRKSRVEAGWTLSTLAEEAFGNSDRKGFVSQIERGKRPITPLTAGKLAEALALKDDVLDLILKGDLPAEDTTTAEDSRAAQLLAETEKDGDPAIGEDLLIALAYEYAGTDTTDVRIAHQDLKAALEAATRMQARAELPDNTDDGVAAVRAALQQLNKTEGPEAGGAYLDDAIARKAAEMGALLDLGVDQDRVRNDPGAAAQKVLMKLQTDAIADWDAIRETADHWLDIGQRMGRSFDLKVAENLFNHALQTAPSPQLRGRVMEQLAQTTLARGMQETSPGTLSLAVTLFRDRITQTDRAAHPVDWARLYHALGTALQVLAGRTGDLGDLKAAADAYEQALLERRPDIDPMDWAKTQNNLAAANATLGEKMTDSARLESAAHAYRAALTVFSKEDTPAAWASAQSNLGNVLATLGMQGDDAGKLKQAVEAYQAALEVQSKEQQPMLRATTQHNLGNVLLLLHRADNDLVTAQAALAAFDAALRVRSPDKTPLSWAMSQENKSEAHVALFQKTGDAQHLDAAENAVSKAYEMYQTADAADHLKNARSVINQIKELRARVRTH
ncbi:hypothetical protein [Yoonia sp. SS1-5]|uniref:HTH cro/C1-type domain-containing protein n=1 Tax=Yoonia rhodophyticola TaxID=3137370 RepID=A0AAN0M8J8_9RHOB